VHESAFGTKRTSSSRSVTSAFGSKADIAIFRAFERSSAVVLYPASGTDASGRAKEELRSPRKLPSLLLSPFRPLSQRLLRSFEQLSLDRCVAQIRKSTTRKLTPGNHIRPSAFKTWLPWLRTPTPSPLSASWEPSVLCRILAMKIERFAGHNEAREALMISVASVTAIMLTAYLILLILY
jgi:hypothetical protein